MSLKTLLVISLVLVAACAAPRQRRPKPPPGARLAPVVRPEIGPERKASEALIQKGVDSMDQGLFDRAEDNFQDAVNLDPSNGAGFYYLALIKYKLGEYETVPNFLEKAEALLKNDPDWTGRLESLRRDSVTPP